MNLATMITLSRVCLVPVFMLLVLTADHVPLRLSLAAGVFVIAAITDGLDGYVARARREVTKLGQLVDPVADKMLVSTALIVLVELGYVSAWIASLIVAREFAVSGLRIFLASEGILLPAGVWGKIKTVAQIVAIVAVTISFPFGGAIMWLAALITVVSAVDYFVRARPHLV